MTDRGRIVEAVAEALHTRGEGGKETWEEAGANGETLRDWYREWAAEVVDAALAVTTGPDGGEPLLGFQNQRVYHFLPPETGGTVEGPVEYQVGEAGPELFRPEGGNQP